MAKQYVCVVYLFIYISWSHAGVVIFFACVFMPQKLTKKPDFQLIHFYSDIDVQSGKNIYYIQKQCNDLGYLTTPIQYTHTEAEKERRRHRQKEIELCV